MKTLKNIALLLVIAYVGFHALPYFVSPEVYPQEVPKFVLGDFVQIVKVATVEQSIDVSIDTVFEVDKNWINEQTIGEMFSIKPCIARIKMQYSFKVLAGFNLKDKYTVNINDTTHTATVVISQPSVLSVESDFDKEHDLTTDRMNEPTEIYNKRYVTAQQISTIRQWSKKIAVNKAIENGIFAEALNNLAFVTDYLQRLNPMYKIEIETL